MPGCFLDTTIVVNVTDGEEPLKKRGEDFVKNNQPAEAPYYALRELQAGHLRILCDTHNILLATENAAEALNALLNRAQAEGRKRESKIQALANAMASVFADNPTGKREELKREMLGALALRANSLWRKSQRLKMVSMTQSLSCFNSGKVTYGADGELRGPNDSFNCIKSERCAAAAYIYDNQSNLKKMIDALHPKNLDSKIAAKNETGKRRKALKELRDKGPVGFHKGDRKSTRLNSSHTDISRMPSSA